MRIRRVAPVEAGRVAKGAGTGALSPATRRQQCGRGRPKGVSGLWEKRRPTPRGKRSISIPIQSPPGGSDWRVDRGGGGGFVARRRVARQKPIPRRFLRRRSPAPTRQIAIGRGLIETVDKYRRASPRRMRWRSNVCTTRGRDADGNPLFRLDRAMAGEAFRTQTRMRIIRNQRGAELVARRSAIRDQ